MADGYTARKALVDFGFVNGWLYGDALPDDDFLFETLLETMGRISDYATSGALEKSPADPYAFAKFIYDVGKLRGLLWSHPIPQAVSEALGRLLRFVTGCEEFPCLLIGHESSSESKAEMLSDGARDALLHAASEGKCLFRLGLCGGVDATQDAIVRYTCQGLGATDFAEAKEWSEEARREWEVEQKAGAAEPAVESTKAKVAPPQDDAEPDSTAVPQALALDLSVNPFNPSGKRGTREWTPEQRETQANRARGQKKPPFDSDFDSVKGDFDAGMSTGAIGKKWGCSDTHIRNFLTRHGVDPRRSKNSPRAEVSEEHETGQNAQESESLGENQAQQPQALDVESDAGNVFELIDEDEEQADGEAAVSEPDLDSRRITVSLPGRAGMVDRQLTDSDWPDIKEMLSRGRDQKAIASDYDVDPEDLHFFIASNQRREAKQPPGEAHAPL